MNFIKHFPRKYECAFNQIRHMGKAPSSVYYQGFTRMGNRYTVSANAYTISPITIMLDGTLSTSDFLEDWNRMFSDPTTDNHVVEYTTFIDPFLSGVRNSKAGGAFTNKEREFAFQLGRHLYVKYFLGYGEPYEPYNTNLLLEYGVKL